MGGAGFEPAKADCHQIYSLTPLTARETPLHICFENYVLFGAAEKALDLPAVLL